MQHKQVGGTQAVKKVMARVLEVREGATNPPETF